MPEPQSRPEPEQEELDFLRGKIGSLSMRGDYAGCIKLIEENVGALYEKERWPDVFFATLRTYQRCWGLMGRTDSMEARLVPFLKKGGVPEVFAYLLRHSDNSISWNADYFKNLAMTNERHGDFESALSYCDVIIKLDPSSSQACVLRGWILDDLNRHNEAVKMYEQALELNESNHSARNSLAKHYADSNPQLALEYIEKAIELAPTEGSYYDTKARILVRLNDREGAVFCYDLAMSASPYSAEYPYRKGELLLQDGKEIAAIAQYRKALALDSEHVPTLWRLAGLYKDSQPEMALTYLNTIATVQPDNADVKLLKGQLLGKLGREELAAGQFKELIHSDPERHEALAGYANLLLHKDPASALVFYDKAIVLAPKEADYRMGRGRALELLGMDAQAVKEYRKAIELDKTNARAYARLAALVTETKPREAVELYTKAIKIMPDNAFYHAAKAELLMTMNRADEALASFINASKYDPTNAKLHVFLGGIFEGKGNNASAVEHFKQAAALDQNDPDIFYRLARLLLSTEPEVALMHINSAISLDGKNGEYYYLKSKVLNELGHDRQALEQLQESLRSDPKHEEALREISMLLGDDRPKVALMYIDRAIGIAADNTEYLCQRADLLLGMERNQQASEQYGAVLKLEPKNHKAMFGMGKCLLPEQGALEYFDKAIAIDDQVPEYHAEKAAFLAERGEPEAALKSYRTALALEPDNFGYQLREAKLLDELGKTDEACGAYRKVLDRSPENLDALSRLGALLAETSPTEAIRFLDHAIDLAPKDYLNRAWKGRALLALGDKSMAAAEYQTASRLGGETAETYFTLAGLLQDKMPEIALGYALHSIEEDESRAEYHLLCGDIYQQLDQIGQALDCYKKTITLDHDCHEAREKIAAIFFEKKDSNALKSVEFALEQNPECETCMLMRAKILNEDDEERDVDELIEYVDEILSAHPKSIAAHEMLIQLLAEKRAFVRLNMEKIKLTRLKRQGEKS